MNSKQVNELHTRVTEHLNQIYPEIKVDEFASKLIETMGLDKGYSEPARHKNHWSERDVAVITYADTFKREDEVPLKTLKQFLIQHLKETISIVHVLPFFPYSSDDGFQ